MRLSDARVKRGQLKRTSSHIAKGIYARAANIRPAEFAELLRFVEGLRRSHYLDGPNDVDWIFRNEIEAQRDERLYVDYVETDEGDMWISPERYDVLGARNPSAAVELVGAFSRAGFCDPRALGVVAEVWREFQPSPETRWSEDEQLTRATLEQLPADAVDDELSDEDIRRILETWTFPLYGTDLQIVEEDLERLREQQRERDPDGRSLTDYY